jgi:hypothetical protein
MKRRGKGIDWINHLNACKDKGTIQGYEVKTGGNSSTIPIQGDNDQGGRLKYGNTTLEHDGIVFDSKKELKRWKELLIMQKAGLIGLLQRQVWYTVLIDELPICTYIADHVYRDAVTGEQVVEDVKSDITRKLPTYRLKKKMLAQTGIIIKEI